METLQDSGIRANRRNVELVARGLVNHVELDEEMDTYVPGGRVPYNMLEKHYKSREGAKECDAASAVGKYLERPILHYTIGVSEYKSRGVSTLCHFRPSKCENSREFDRKYAIGGTKSIPPLNQKLTLQSP